jgi:hypothetical protein
VYSRIANVTHACRNCAMWSLCTLVSRQTPSPLAVADVNARSSFKFSYTNAMPMPVSKGGSQVPKTGAFAQCRTLTDLAVRAAYFINVAVIEDGVERDERLIMKTRKHFSSFGRRLADRFRKSVALPDVPRSREGAKVSLRCVCACVRKAANNRFQFATYLNELAAIPAVVADTNFQKFIGEIEEADGDIEAASSRPASAHTAAASAGSKSTSPTMSPRSPRSSSASTSPRSLASPRAMQPTPRAQAAHHDSLTAFGGCRVLCFDRVFTRDVGLANMPIGPIRIQLPPALMSPRRRAEMSEVVFTLDAAATARDARDQAVRIAGLRRPGNGGVLRIGVPRAGPFASQSMRLLECVDVQRAIAADAEVHLQLYEVSREEARARGSTSSTASASFTKTSTSATTTTASTNASAATATTTSAKTTSPAASKIAVPALAQASSRNSSQSRMSPRASMGYDTYADGALAALSPRAQAASAAAAPVVVVVTAPALLTTAASAPTSRSVSVNQLTAFGPRKHGSQGVSPAASPRADTTIALELDVDDDDDESGGVSVLVSVCLLDVFA